MKNNDVNKNITDNAIETKAQKTGRNAINLVATICLVLATILFFISVVALMTSMRMNNKVESAPTGEEMLSRILLYDIENVGPYEIVEDVSSYKAHKSKLQDKYTALAIGLGEYREAALCKYAYEYVGDSEKVAECQKIMDNAREKMEVHSYADYIDKNYENLKNK